MSPEAIEHYTYMDCGEHTVRAAVHSLNTIVVTFIEHVDHVHFKCFGVHFVFWSGVHFIFEGTNSDQ